MRPFLKCMIYKDFEYNQGNYIHGSSDFPKMPNVVAFANRLVYLFTGTESYHVYSPKNQKNQILKLNSVYLSKGINDWHKKTQIKMFKEAGLKERLVLIPLISISFVLYPVALAVKILYFSVFPAGRKLYRDYHYALNEQKRMPKLLPLPEIQQPYVVDNSSYFTGLPVDVKREIISHIDLPRDLLNLSKTCKSWHILEQSEILMKAVPEIVKKHIDIKILNKVFLKDPVKIEYLQDYSINSFFHFSNDCYRNFGFKKTDLHKQSVFWGLSRDGFVFLFFNLKRIFRGYQYEWLDYLTFIYNPKKDSFDIDIRKKNERGLGDSAFQNYIARLLKGEKVGYLEENKNGQLIESQFDDQNYVQTFLRPSTN